MFQMSSNRLLNIEGGAAASKQRSRHASTPTRKLPRIPFTFTATARGTPMACLNCHYTTSSPRFSYSKLTIITNQQSLKYLVMSAVFFYCLFWKLSCLDLISRVVEAVLVCGDKETALKAAHTNNKRYLLSIAVNGHRSWLVFRC